jgi:hypothetical protein
MKGILNDKLDHVEAPVPDHLWTQVSSQLASGAVSSSVAGVVWSKIAIWVVAAAAATGLVVYSISTAPSATDSSKKAVVKIEDASPALPSSEPQVVIPVQASILEENEKSQNKTVDTGRSSQKDVLDLEGGIQDPAAAIDNSPKPDGEIIKAPTPEPIAERLETSQWREEKESLPSVSALFDILGTVGAKYEFRAQDVRGDVSYQWQFGDGNEALGPLHSHTYTKAGEYWVSMTCIDASGKQVKSQQKLDIKANGNIQVVNVITPNNDGQNDVFDPAALEPQCVINYLLIMAMDGSRIYESATHTTWDGKLGNGENAPQGSYLYLIRGMDKNNGIIEKSSRLNVVR